MTILHDRRIEVVGTETIKVSKNNARKHSKKQIQQIADSVRRFGWTNPILVGDEGQILAGHGRLAAAKQLGMATVPIVRLDNLTEEEQRAYRLADNQLALNASWDDELLGIELKELSFNSAFDISITGFPAVEIDRYIEGLAVEDTGNPADDLVPASPPAVCAIGDIWQLGNHRLICGNALEERTTSALMQTELATMVLTDPPYNLAIENIGSRGQIKHRDFAMASGEMSKVEFVSFLNKAFAALVKYSRQGALHYIFMDWRHMGEMLAAGESHYSELKNLIVWAKDNGGMGTFYRSAHELIFIFKVGAAPHENNFELGQFGRYRTNVWRYPGVNTRKAGRLEELEAHPTPKPVQMLADAIKDVTARGEIVLDLFAGSGSTLIAAEKTGRRAYVSEIDPIYCDTIIRRWEDFANDTAHKIETVAPDV